MNCCDSWGNCTRGPGCPAGSVVAEKMLQGEKLPGLVEQDAGQRRERELREAAYADLIARQWVTPRRSSFTPLYNEPDEESDEPLVSPFSVGWAFTKFALCALAFVLIAIGVLWSSLDGFFNQIFH